MTVRRLDHAYLLMKAKRTILIIMGAGFFAAMLFSCSLEHPPSAVQWVFLGYTNTQTGPEAVFSVRFPSRFGGCGWGDLVVSRREGAGWERLSTPSPASPKMRMFNGPVAPSAAGPQLTAEAFAAIAVERTNEVYRVVIQVDENPPLESRARWAVRTIWGWLRMNPVTPGRSYFITNETVLQPAE